MEKPNPIAAREVCLSQFLRLLLYAIQFIFIEQVRFIAKSYNLCRTICFVFLQPVVCYRFEVLQLQPQYCRAMARTVQCATQLLFNRVMQPGNKASKPAPHICFLLNGYFPVALHLCLRLVILFNAFYINP